MLVSLRLTPMREIECRVFASTELSREFAELRRQDVVRQIELTMNPPTYCSR